MDQKKFVVIGLGGYGLVHINAVRWLERQGMGKLVGVVALEVDRAARPDLVESLKSGGVTLYESVEDFMNTGVRTTDILTVPVGIHQHVPISIEAMKAGLDVYCEKPAAATVQEVDALIGAQKATHKTVTIGFQHIYSNSIQRLKRLICDGALGHVHSVSLLCGWPRSLQYYARNDWTGKMRLRDSWLLDSPANNANAHYVLNALYLCSPAPQCAGVPEVVRAELYRANAIESADTVQFRFVTGEGTRGHILLTHANRREVGPLMKLECETGTVYWQSDNGNTCIRFKGGKVEGFDNVTHPEWRYDPFKDLVEALHEGREPLCTPLLARSQTLAVNLMHESCPRITSIPDAFVEHAEDWEIFPPNTKGNFRRIKDLDEQMTVAFLEGEFLSALGVPWATSRGTKEIFGEGYTRFPQHSRAEDFLSPTSGPA